MVKSISIMIPAYNEEDYLEKTVDLANNVAKSIFQDYEILIFDDKSSDSTGKIADALAKKNSRIKVIHNKKNMGLGYNYRTGIKLAQKEYYFWIPGDNDIPENSVKSILQHCGKADVIMAFTINKEARHLYRRFLSACYTIGLNFLFGLNLKYYNGLSVNKTKLVKNLRLRTNSFALQTEIIIKLIKKGHSYKEVPQIQRGVKESRIFKVKNMVGIIAAVLALFFEIHFGRKSRW